MATTASSPAPIEPHVLYPLDDAKRCLGWGNHAMRAARRNGLRVKYVGKRAYLLGSEIIAFVEREGRDEK